eukprot:5243637-Pyramimonas_sp.AAC.1
MFASMGGAVDDVLDTFKGHSDAVDRAFCVLLEMQGANKDASGTTAHNSPPGPVTYWGVNDKNKHNHHTAHPERPAVVTQSSHRTP